MLTLRHALSALALPLILCTSGCFDDPAVNDSTTTNNAEDSETGTDACPDGSAGCDCYGNNTCDAELECVDEICKLPECVAGSLNCDCYEGVCLTGLVCMEGVCKPEDPMMGCESVADCDGNLCTQGDALCQDACVPGVGVECPLGANCDSHSGSCQCEPGSKVCGNACIPDTQCCGDSDCAAGSTCQEGFCTCDGGLVCNSECIVNASCCPGEVTFGGCNCGSLRTCTPEGVWSECMGGTLEPECEPGQITECGDKCGSRICNAECLWSDCQGEGPCTPGEMGCTGQPMCQLLFCNQSCFWDPDLMGGKCC
jgi:hypothetical protein